MSDGWASLFALQYTTAPNSMGWVRGCFYIFDSGWEQRLVDFYLGIHFAQFSEEVLLLAG